MFWLSHWPVVARFDGSIQPVELTVVVDADEYGNEDVRLADRLHVLLLLKATMCFRN